MPFDTYSGNKYKEFIIVMPFDTSYSGNKYK